MRRNAGLLFITLFLAACGSRKAEIAHVAPTAPVEQLSNKPAATPAVGPKAIAHAKAYAQSGKLPGDARRDCSGFVVAAFQATGKPLEIPIEYHKHKAVSVMLHEWSKAEKRVVGAPKAGDVVFFRDTYGQLLGKVTHVGLVEEVKDDGTVVVLHYMSGKIRRDLLNVTRPSDPQKNGWLRRKKSAKEPALAGELFVAYARF